jgi:hypothetical protein
MHDLKTPQPADSQVTAYRISIVVLFGVIGLGSMFWSWSTTHTSGYFYPELAMLGPAVLVLAIYYAIIPEDPRRLPSPIPARLWSALVIALLAGAANWFALSHGLY